MQNIPETLDIQELMEVKGGFLDKTQVCILAAAVKCTVAGSGVIVQSPPSTGSVKLPGSSIKVPAPIATVPGL